MSQHGTEFAAPHLCHVFTACAAYDTYQTRVRFIPTEAKAQYRLISLSSFLLKMLEKLMNKYVRDDVITNRPLHRNQSMKHGRSTANAFRNVAIAIQNATAHKEIALRQALIQRTFSQNLICCNNKSCCTATGGIFHRKMDKHHTAKQQPHSHTVWGDCRLSAGKRAFASAVESGCGSTSWGAQRRRLSCYSIYK